MGKRERNKGYRAERDLVKYLNAVQVSAHRVPLSGAQYPYKGDVIAKGLFGDSPIEVKHREDISDRYWDWLDGNAAVCMRKNRHGWLIMMHLPQFLNLIEEVKRGKKGIS